MTDNERKLSQQLFGGLTWDKISSDLGKELTHQIAAGAHELAAALFNGNGFVMYQRDGKDDQPSHEQTQDSQHLERGGRSM
jgi:hypothetical protein